MLSVRPRLPLHTARDWPEALAIFREHAGRFGLVILDTRMPGPPPVELYNLLHEISPSVSVLFCSGVSPNDPEIRATKEHGIQLLPKPFNRGALHTAILRASDEEQTQTAVARYYRTVMG